MDKAVSQNISATHKCNIHLVSEKSFSLKFSYKTAILLGTVAPINLCSQKTEAGDSLCNSAKACVNME